MPLRRLLGVHASTQASAAEISCELRSSQPCRLQNFQKPHCLQCSCTCQCSKHTIYLGWVPPGCIAHGVLNPIKTPDIIQMAA